MIGKLGPAWRVAMALGVAAVVMGPTLARADDPPAIRAHASTLAECLALADRNFPNVWAARARLGYAHAQLSEARSTPWFQWTTTASFGVTPPYLGSAIYPQSTLDARNITSTGNLQPFFSFSLNGVIPIYTFGKIGAATAAAEANVRVNEWDMERARQAVRLDVRRAYYGVELGRDMEVVFHDALEHIDSALRGIADHIARGDRDVTEIDRIRLEAYRLDVTSQALQGPKEEAYGMSALRFLTGEEGPFDVVDAPLARPDRPLMPVAQYLEASRVWRPDVNMARAGVAARRALVDLGRARLFPDIGLGLGVGITSTPNAVSQQNGWAYDVYNGFGYGFAFGMRWSLDLLPQGARTEQAESQLEETRALERIALGNATFEVEKAYADVVEARAREEATERSEHLAKQWLALAQDHVDLGTWDERSLSEPLRVHAGARLAHLRALRDLDVAASALALASGWDAAAPTGD